MQNNRTYKPPVFHLIGLPNSAEKLLMNVLNTLRQSNIAYAVVRCSNEDEDTMEILFFGTFTPSEKEAIQNEVMDIYEAE